MEIELLAAKSKGSDSAEFAYFIRRAETCLQVLLNQSSAIHTKSGCNKEERLTQLCVPADYLVLNHRAALNLCRELELHLPHTSYLHPYHWLLVPLWLQIAKTRLWCELNQPCLSHVRVQLTLTWWESMSSGPSPLLHPHSVLLSLLLPSPPSPLLKVANELWIPLTDILTKVLHPSTFSGLQWLTSLSQRAKAAKSRTTEATLLLCLVPAGI